MSAPAPAAALGYSIVANLDGNRQITVQCFVAEDEEDTVVNAKLDRVFRVIDRQKARYDIVGEREELAKEEATLAQLLEDLARVDADFDKAQASLDVQITEMSAQKDQAYQQGYAEHQASGRRGEYKPSGALGNQVRNTDQAIANAVEAKVKNEAERAQHRTGVEISVERYQKAIADRKARIAENEKLLGG